MVNQTLAPTEWPDASYDEGELAKLFTEFRTRYRARDLRSAIWRALIHRRSEHQSATGTFVPKPFDKSQLVIQFMSGDPLYMTQQMVAKITENQPIVQVNSIAKIGAEIGERAKRQTGDVERALMAMWHAAGGEAIQQELAWSAITQGVGWCLSHEVAAGWGLPDRTFYDEEPDDEIARTGLVPIDDDSGFKYGERADLWARRKAEAMEAKALKGESLFFMEPLSNDKCYYDFDLRGLKSMLIIDDVPGYHFAPREDGLKGTPYYEQGLIESSNGTVVGGVSRGEVSRRISGNTERSSGIVPSYWTLFRFYSRDEIYYYVTRLGGADGGLIIYYTSHDYGEVPVYPCPFNISDSLRPEERYVGALEAAFAYTPLINQIATLMSNLVAFKGTPRFLLQMPDGQFQMDEVSGEPKTYEPELYGNDPAVTDVLQGGGKLVSINSLLPDDPSMIKLIELYLERSDRLLPGEAVTGTGGASGPAWTTRQMQEAGSRFLRPAIASHASMTESIMRQWLRTIRRRGEDVGVLSLPGSRGDERGMQYYVNVKPDAITDNITVKQDPHTVEERTAMTQIGETLLEKGRIDDRSFYEDWMGVEDADEAIFRKDVQTVVNMILQDAYKMTYQLVMGTLPAAIAGIAPNAAMSAAQSVVGPQGGGQGNTTLAGPISEAAGVVSPGMGMSPTQPALAPLQGAPVGGAVAPVASGGM